MTWVLWAIIAILWTLVVLIVGYAAARQALKNEGADNVTYNLAGVDGREAITGPVGPMGATGAPGPPGPPGAPGPAADVLGTELPNGMSLGEWVAAADTRFTRVERKAGMSV